MEVPLWNHGFYNDLMALYNDTWPYWSFKSTVTRCLLKNLFYLTERNTPKPCITGPLSYNPPLTGGFSPQRASNVESFSVAGRHLIWLTPLSPLMHMCAGKLDHFYLDKAYYILLTHSGRDKMAAIFQTTFSNAFFLNHIYKFRLRFHKNLFIRVQLTIFQDWFR